MKLKKNGIFCWNFDKMNWTQITRCLPFNKFDWLEHTSKHDGLFLVKPQQGGQITLIINRAGGVVVIYVNLCHILSHHFLALTTKRKSMIKLKPEQKGTFKSTAGLTFSPNLKSSREIFYEKWRQRRRVSYVAVSCWNRAESEKDTWDQFSPSNFANLCHKQLFPLLLKIIVCLWGSHLIKRVKEGVF